MIAPYAGFAPDGGRVTSLTVGPVRYRSRLQLSPLPECLGGDTPGRDEVVDDHQAAPVLGPGRFPGRDACDGVRGGSPRVGLRVAVTHFTREAS